jgi:hypothetical protein
MSFIWKVFNYVIKKVGQRSTNAQHCVGVIGADEHRLNFCNSIYLWRKGWADVPWLPLQRQCFNIACNYIEHPFMPIDSIQNAKENMQVIVDNIENYGCHLTLIEPDNYLPGFVYSIGLFKKFRHPELICFGLKTDVMAAILNHACDLIKNGEILTTNKLYSGFLEGYKIQFLQVDRDYYPNYVGYAGWFYDMTIEFPLFQLVWPDKQHNFPWDTNFNPDWKFKQPLLDRNTGFKFYEKRNLGVFTTKQAFNGDPILYVYHNEDGDWQFHTSLEPNLGDSMHVCLEEIIKLDPTINEVYHLQFGWRAWRDTKESEWKCEEHPDDE